MPLPSTNDITLTADEVVVGEEILADVRSLSSLNAYLFNHLRHLLLPVGKICPLPPHSKIHTTKVSKDGRALELYIGILFHCMGWRVIECGGGSGDNGVDVKVQSPQGEIVLIQCKQYSKHVVGMEVGLQLLGTMFYEECNVGLLVTCNTVSKDIKLRVKALPTIRGGIFKLHVWEGDSMIKLFGRYGRLIKEKRDSMLCNAAANISLQPYIRGVGNVLRALSLSPALLHPPVTSIKKESAPVDDDDDEEISELSISLSDNGDVEVDNVEPPSTVESKKKWTMEEVLHLRRGVAKWGESNWAAILGESRLLAANGKTPLKLRDKWRNVKTKETNAMTPKKIKGEICYESPYQRK